MPGLTDSKTGFAFDVGTGLIWLRGGLGGDAEVIQRTELAFQLNAFQINAFQMGLSFDAFETDAFQNNAFQVGP